MRSIAFVGSSIVVGCGETAVVVMVVMTMIILMVEEMIICVRKIKGC
jgi:hypothetical protein